MPGKLQVAKVSYARNVNNKIRSGTKARERGTDDPFRDWNPLHRRVKVRLLMPAVYDSGPQGRSKVAQ